MDDTPHDDVDVKQPADDGAKNGPSSSADVELDPVARAEQHSALGARCHALKKYAEAADAHSKACEVLASHFGELAPKVAPPLLAYGKSLLEYARSRSAVLGLQAGAKDGATGETAQASDQQPEGESPHLSLMAAT